MPALAPVHADAGRITGIKVCTRPFRAAGPRLDAEQVGDTLVVHNYGHGGSGWSLSWGAGMLAVQRAMEGSPHAIAVLGCGAMGITSAILAQRTGARVTIYACETAAGSRSAKATGSWSPDSRIALVHTAAPNFPTLWERMARASFAAYQAYGRRPGSPVEWCDRYLVSDISHQHAARLPANPVSFARYENRISDLMPASEDLQPGSTEFGTRYIRRLPSLQFNIPDYTHALVTEFLQAGGRFEQREFHAPSDLMALPEKVVINCPGYGARSLWRDTSIVPVRGQITLLPPQPQVNYSVIYRDVIMLSRRDGVVVQSLQGGDMRGYGIETETPDRREAEAAVSVLGALYAAPKAKTAEGKPRPRGTHENQN